ncbi:MAG: ribonuclease H-like domain-containing protein [Archangiaceae bacterium]|nr:ribonuclease H-like domain-containing protein [Archangiaceae bacterium]
MIERTFQIVKGVGPWREKDIWARGIADWAAFEKASGVVASEGIDAELKVAISKARTASLAELAKLFPEREHWRLYPKFVEQAAFMDLEADGDEQITVGGVFDARGVATFIRGFEGERALQHLPGRLMQSPIWVTFNGGTFDIPVLRRHFPEMKPPTVHIDLRFLVRRVRLKGGLKEVEETLGLHRPPHLKGIKGYDAIRLWREWQTTRNPDALRILVEYNLYDAINLRSLVDLCITRAAEQLAWDEPYRAPFERGEILYDVSKLLLEL